MEFPIFRATENRHDPHREKPPVSPEGYFPFSKFPHHTFTHRNEQPVN